MSTSRLDSLVCQPRWTRADAREVLDALERSGKSVRVFVRPNAGSIPNASMPGGHRLGAAEPTTFQEIVVRPTGVRLDATPFEIVLASGDVVRVPPVFGKASTRRVEAAIRAWHAESPGGSPHMSTSRLDSLVCQPRWTRADAREVLDALGRAGGRFNEAASHRGGEPRRRPTSWRRCTSLQRGRLSSRRRTHLERRPSRRSQGCRFNEAASHRGGEPPEPAPGDPGTAASTRPPPQSRRRTMLHFLLAASSTFASFQRGRLSSRRRTVENQVWAQRAARASTSAASHRGGEPVGNVVSILQNDELQRGRLLIEAENTRVSGMG